MVSVVITTCRRAPEILNRAVRSVLCQTYSDWELIIVDDSPESYEERAAVRQMIEQMKDDRIRYIAHEVNKGACASRNTGLAAAEGKYIAYLDDDDEWLPEKLATQVQKAEETDSDTAVIYCSWYVKDDKTGVTTAKKLEVHRGWVYDSLILINYIGSTSFPLIRTECLREIGGFDPLMQSSQDYDAWLRLAARYRIDCVEEPLACYHRYDGERITTNIPQKIAGLERLNEKNLTYLRNHPEAFAVRYMKLAVKYTQSGQMGKALKIWWGAFVKCPWRVVQNLKYLIYILREHKKCVTKR